MENTALERNLLTEKDLDRESERSSENDDFEEVFLSWNARNYRSYMTRFRDWLKDVIQSHGQRFLLVSLGLVNVMLLVSFLAVRKHEECYNSSPIVGLVPNAFERTMSILTPYATPHENNTARDELWETLAIDRGAVAVDQETIEKHGLPDSMVFPWDTTKKVYIINAFHQLHCLKLLYRTLTNVHYGKPLTQYEHMVHCLDQLRQDVHCQADDNLYYVGDINSGHKRQCRDFSKLDEWALDHHACYSFKKPPVAGVLDVEAFSNCRESSPYKQAMKDHFGYGDDYVPKFPPNEGPTFQSW